MWKCSNCSEHVEEQFQVCWNCGFGRDGEAPSSPPAHLEANGDSPGINPRMVLMGRFPEDLHPREQVGPSTSPAIDPKMAEQTIRRWVIVGFVFSVLYTLIAVWNLVGSDSPFQFHRIGWIVLVVGMLFWTGTMFAVRRRYTAARVFFFIGGIIAFPLGLVMIRGGKRIEQAGESLEQDAPPAVGLTS